jgi:uncharacterized protein YcfJ
MMAEWCVNAAAGSLLSRTVADFVKGAVSNEAWRRYLCACVYKTMRECRKVNKSLTVGLVLGAVAASTVGAVAGYRMVTTPSGAPVISAKALVKTVRTPRKECHDEQVTHTKPVKDENRLAGTGIGAVVGGLLGSRIGGGNTRIATGLAGAAAGGYAGNKIQQKMQQGNTYTTTEQRCVTAYDSHEETTGYDVVYELDGKRHHVQMDHDPGREIPVRDGQIMVDSAKPESNS